MGEGWDSKDTTEVLTRRGIAADLAKKKGGLHLATGSIHSHKAQVECMRGKIGLLQGGSSRSLKKQLKAQVKSRVCWRYLHVQRLPRDSREDRNCILPTPRTTPWTVHQETDVVKWFSHFTVKNGMEVPQKIKTSKK